MLEDHWVAWVEAPLPADDVLAHVALGQETCLAIALGASLYSLSLFKEYVQAGTAWIVQVDVAPTGGITPWLKVAQMAEAFNVMVCPHFLMELHLPLVRAVPNASWLEYIPQLDRVTGEAMRIEEGNAIPSDVPGLGIEWDWITLSKETVFEALVT